MESLTWQGGPVPVQYMDDGTDSGCDLETSVFLEEHAIRRTIIYSGRNSKHSSSDDHSLPTELSTDHSSPGVLKIFGGTIVPGVEYKSVLASCRSTAPELVKQALERYGLSATLHDEYVLCDVVGRANAGSTRRLDVNNKVKQEPRWKRMCSRILSDKDRPLFLQKFWRPSDGFCRRYELRRKMEVIDSMGDDDTYGLNENARKISFSKLRPGAIPFFVPWTQSLDRLRDEYDLEGSSSSNSWTCNNNNQNNLMRSISFDVKGQRTDVSLPSKTGSDHVLAPISRPFLLTLRGYDVNKDSLFYILEGKTMLVCCPDGAVMNKPCMTLSAPDINPQHCHIHLKRSSYSHLSGALHHNYCLEVECNLTSNIRVNGSAVVGRETLQAGDIISIGNYYVFLFKDFTAGNDIPSDLPWISSSSDDIFSDSMRRKQNNAKRHQNVVHVPPLMLGSTDDNISITTMESQGTEVQREKFRFAYSREKEDELVNAIGAVIRLDQTNFVLAPAYLYSMCIQFSCVRFDPYQIRNLLLRILAAVTESAAAISKALKENKFNSGLVRSRRHPSVSEDFLREMLQWISNCVQLILYLRADNFRLPRTSVTRGSPLDSDVHAAFRDLATGLEEIVVFCFQQSIYTITKALYLLLPILLDGNPFTEDAGSRHGVGKVIAILDSVAGLVVSLRLHNDVIKQLFMYIFFFCSTSVFNRLFLKEPDAAEQYYTWAAGVRIKANLGKLEEWAIRNNLDEEFEHLFERLITVAEFLSTSKALLEKYDWLTMKKHFHPLNEAQLYRLLSGYHADRHIMPENWHPSPEDVELALREDEVMLDLSGHPAFLLPTEGCDIDLMHPPDAGQFWALFKQLYAQFGLSEDESDIGLSPGNTPRFTGNFPKVELQKSFFCQTSSSRSRTMSPHRKVQFVADTDSSTQSTPRGRKTPNGVVPGSSPNLLSKVTDKNKTTAPVKPKRNLLKSNLSPRQTDSPDKRLDMLINKSGSPVMAGGDVTDRSEPESVTMDTSTSPVGMHTDTIPVVSSKSMSIEEAAVKADNPEYTRNSANAIRVSAPPPVPPRQPMNEVSREKPTGRRVQRSVSDILGRPDMYQDSCIDSEQRSDFDRMGNHTDDEQGKISARSGYHTDGEQNNSSARSGYHTDGEQNKSFAKSRNHTDGEQTKSSARSEYRADGEQSKNSTRSGNHMDGEQDKSAAKSGYHTKGEKDRNSTSYHTDGELALDRNGNDEEEEFCSKDLMLSVNKQILEAHKQHSEQALPVALPRSPTNIHVEERFDMSTSSRLSSNPVFSVNVRKGNQGLGLGLIDGLYTPLRLAGIYIRKVLPDSPAALSGSLHVGDRLLCVNGKSIVGADYQSAMRLIKASGENLTLLVAKGNRSIAGKISSTNC
ncbi:ras-associating and dilute domain-containing protein-like [Mizuhopecten yessoensis]|uniref:Ras-associating and dilute domain-containing protein n=1 Tax=Mizuhopecten yessoensis TaxID=6573 RepID=A0A210QX39_MIZYE|nr:ras-associating and dilute domain-containing protein-like [Mizuhopecten yessoensis]XP_021347422.1 ras-associating and dilute domain-containing protein-like [Mizuhopecten yessoensis]OWF53328.1 Ras-associating and dilute domain-containing protein [Mizuhopecten yessoensis]